MDPGAAEVSKVVIMAFQNTLTWKNMVHDGQENMYHIRYESEVGIFEKEMAAGPKRYPIILGGQRLEARSHFDDISPIDASMIVGKFPSATKEDVDRAVEAAQGAFNSWSHTDHLTRAKIFERAADLMDEERFRFSAALTFDNGKDRDEAIAETDEAIDFIRWYVDAMRRNNGYEQDMHRPYEDERPKSLMRPYGVWAVVCPFNFPLAISCGMMSGAMITGNTVVAKPSSPAPLPVYLLYDVLERAGLPGGVMNVVSGSGAEVGDHLVQHPGISGTVFTGSKDVGYDIIRKSLKKYPTPVIAEMGGKNAALVMASADQVKAAKGIIQSAFSFSGQKCSACSRVYVHESIYDPFMKELVKRTEALVVGDPRKKGTFVGPVIHAKAVQDYERYVEMARKDGKVLTGGKIVKPEGVDGKLYAAPTIVGGLPDDHFLVMNELFVPILCVLKCRSVEDAVRKSNSVDFGLTSGIFTKEQQELQYYFDNIEAGVCYANRARGATTGAMVGGQPFGGWKASGSTGKGTGTDLYLTQFMRQQARTIGM
ncbi:MAG: NAD(P)-dependent glyceraldehyde-3-phosphate dehydrogenase [Methanomassiliicoccales archaeon PtaU1.Bin124]|nr:MAG: NAD(P)-dependent glyceraldehyde-3-phosphate dehydrogenase [Methanomassiliicoccales archaeon PtaU1.Bin124]